MTLDTTAVTDRAKGLGFDLAGFVSVERLPGDPGSRFHPAGFAPHLPTLIVLAMRSYRGLRVTRHAGTRQFWGGRFLKKIDDAALRLSASLESSGFVSTPFSSLMVDYAEGGSLQLTPAGQGSELLRAAAVEAGLGTVGLNGMLLTPEFGPRVYLAGVLTTAPLEGRGRIATELCPGLETCGWCAAVCPAGAIPREGPTGAALDAVRGLDREACASESQPLGLDRFRRHLHDVFERRDDPEATWEVVGSRTTGALWQEMIMIKEGVFTGCSECVAVCPVGADRQADGDGISPPAGFSRHITEGLVTIEGVTPA